MSSIEVEKLSAFYGKAQALTDVSLQAAKGEIIAVVGANGAGKSTLLDSIMGLVTCTGTVRINGDVEKNIEAVHRLFPRLAERESQETATQSGGERQMVSLGRALMTSPEILLVDEPTIGLAPKVCLEIADVLRKLSAEMGLTVIVTEQNANFALSLAHRLYVLESGKMTASGTADELSKDDTLVRSYFGG